MAVVQIKELVKDFPVHKGIREALRHPFAGTRKRVLDGVDLEVRAGEVVGVLGVNGAGKTTLLKIIGTIVQPTSGTVLVGGIDVATRPQEAKAIVAYNFVDDRSFFWRLSCRENLEFFAATDNLFGNAARSAIAEVTCQLNVTDYLDQPFSVCSSGIRQRLALARALLRQPRVLLLDEPTRSVDPAEAQNIWTFLRQELVARQGMSLLLVTHQVNEAAENCDRIMIMEGGRLGRGIEPRDLERASNGLHGLTLTMDGFSRSGLERLRLIRGVREVSFSEQGGEQQLDIWCEGDEAIGELVAATTASGARLRSLTRGVPIHELVSRLVGNGVSKSN